MSIRKAVVTIAALLLITIAFAPTALYAQTTYYVAPTGSDSSAGTQSAPFHTIQHAANLVNPGDTVIVADGTYTAPGGTSCSANPVLCLTRGGTSTAWVTIRAQNQGGAKLYGQGTVSATGVVFAGAAYVTLQGFEIYDFQPGVVSSSTGVNIQYGHDIVLSQLHIHDIGRACTDTAYGMAGVFVRVPHVTITRSMLHDIGRLAPGEQGCQPATTYYQGNDHGLYIDGAYASSTTPGAGSILISDNIFYRLQHGWSIQLYPGTLDSVRIINNTFAFPNPYRDGHIIIGASMSNSVISNNIFYKPTTDAIKYYTGTQTSLQVADNVVYGASLMSSTPSGTTVSGTKTADPLFFNATTEPYDFRLQSSSPAIGAGATYSDVTVDYDGYTRPVGAYDVGAHQMMVDSTTTTTTSTPPPPPPPSTSDTTPPTISFSSPSNGSTVKHNVTFTVAASDNVGVASVKFYLDGALFVTDTGSPYSATYNFTKVAAGSHVVSAIASDAAGNTATASITVIK